MTKLPESHLETICFLIQHLLKVAEYSEFTKMSIDNLAMTFGPAFISSDLPVVDTADPEAVMEALRRPMFAVYL